MPDGSVTLELYGPLRDRIPGDSCAISVQDVSITLEEAVSRLAAGSGLDEAAIWDRSARHFRKGLVGLVGRRRLKNGDEILHPGDVIKLLPMAPGG